ncbi:transcription antitermination factor NusB [Thermoflexus sp.]|uniref:transcription antitermination factor NusB n=1 Tax=Thermoflexus sp. TaxID=1969742 RepID=UPI0035E4515F
MARRRPPDRADEPEESRRAREGIPLMRRARMVALQALYEIDAAGHPPGEVLSARFQAEPLPAEAQAFVQELVTGVLAHRGEIDRLIQRYAPAWPVAQMAIIDRNILRMAIFEFVIARRTSPAIAINEAVELGKLFGSDSTPRFVNGVLGSIAEEMEGKPEGPTS